MTISIDAEKAFDKVQHRFVIKKKKTTPHPSKFRGNIPQHIKPMYEKPMANIILSGEKLRAFLYSGEQDKDVPSHHYYSTQYWKS